MVNVDGKLISKDSYFSTFNNRGFKYGDALFETIRVVNSKLLFWEDHYLRLMASMRIIRMEIPMNFTMEFIANEILKTVEANYLAMGSARVRFSVYRAGEGYYFPETNAISYVITTETLTTAHYNLNKAPYSVAIFKDYYINSGLLSTLKTNNRILNVIGSIYARENGYDNCLLLNEEKNVVEALNGNLFMVVGHIIKTPPIKDGCIHGILRKQLLRLVSKSNDAVIEEAAISPFELEKADELFITNVIIGIQPITRYRKKEYNIKMAKKFTETLNAIKD